MEKYSDLPMDFADATLVVLAEEVGTNLILTTDRRDFGICRLTDGRSFEVIP
jgi:predicted nucleic acid-binding protein